MIPVSRERANLADDIGLCSAARNAVAGAAACGSTASGSLPGRASTAGVGANRSTGASAPAAHSLSSPSSGAHTVLKMSAWPPSERGSSGEAFALFITVPLPMSWVIA